MKSIKQLISRLHYVSYLLAGLMAWPAGSASATLTTDSAAAANGGGFQQTIDRINSQLGTAGQSGFGAEAGRQASLGNIVGNYVTVFLGFVGTIAFVVFLYGGFLWLTARGNDDQVADAKKYLFNGTIGIVVIVFAYAAAYFITSQLYQAARP